MTFSELIENVEQMKLKNQKTKVILEVSLDLKYILFTLFTRIVWKNPQS